MQKPNRYVFETELEGFINVYQDSGKYENRTFSYKIPEDILTKIEKDRKELLKWVDTKLENPKRVALNPEPWDDEGLCKYSYSDTAKKPIPVLILYFPFPSRLTATEILVSFVFLVIFAFLLINYV